MNGSPAGRASSVWRERCASLLLFGLVPLRIADPGRCEEAAAAHLRSFSGPAPARTDDAAGRHRRHRRGEPKADRAVAVAAHHLGRSGRPPHPHGAVAIGFDIVFAEPDQLSPNLAALSLRDLDAATRAKCDSLPSNDEIFAAAIRRSRVVLGQSVSDSRSDEAAPRAFWRPASSPPRRPDPRTFLVSFPAWCATFRSSKKPPPAAVSLPGRERDGIVRRAPVVMHAGDAFVPSLALEMLRVATNSNSPVIRSDKNGIQGVGFSRFGCPPTARADCGFISITRSRALRIGQGRLARPCRLRPYPGQAGAGRHVGDRSS